MSPFFAGISLVALSVLAWRQGWVTSWAEMRRSRKQTRSADFWTAWTPKPHGPLSPAAPTMADMARVAVEWCDRCPQRATYVAFKDDMDLTLCDHHTHRLVDMLVAVGFNLHLLPGVR